MRHWRWIVTDLEGVAVIDLWDYGEHLIVSIGDLVGISRISLVDIGRSKAELSISIGRISKVIELDCPKLVEIAYDVFAELLARVHVIHEFYEDVGEE